MSECIDYHADPLKWQRKVVCAAIKDATGHVVCGARHYDPVMHQQIDNFKVWEKPIQQGFIDQFGTFLTREEAWVVANAAKQVIKVCGGNSSGKLFSENLY